VEELEERMERLTARKLKLYMLTEDAIMDRKEMTYQMNDMVKNVNEFKKFFDKIESEFNGLRNTIATKASIKALGDLKVDMG